jgi:DNA-binding response OmpR family regulator
LLKVLVIGGVKQARELVVSALEQAAFLVIAVNNISQGLRHLGEARPCLIILMDSHSAASLEALCFQVREISQAPIIVIGSEKGELISARFIEMGADVYMAEPVSVVELVARVSSLLRRSLG